VVGEMCSSPLGIPLGAIALIVVIAEAARTSLLALLAGFTNQ
jgi:hypothetical protein